MGAPKRFANLPAPARRYVLAFWAASGIGLALVLMRHPVTPTGWPHAAILAGAIAVAHLVHTPTREHSYVLSGPFVVTAALVLPPHQAIAAIAVGLLPGEIPTQAAWYTKVFNYALYLSGALLAMVLFRAFTPVPTLLTPKALPAGVLAATAFTMTNLIAVALAVNLTHKRPLRSLLAPRGIVANLAIDGAGLAMAALWEVNPWLLVLGAIPLIGGAYALWMPHLEEELKLDSKTGIYNGRFAIDTLHRLVREHQECRQPLSVIMADIDNLRELNNRHGHLMGDRALQAFADILKTEARGDACVARFGGEEFIAIFPGCETRDAALIAEKVRQRIRIARVRHEHATEDATITVSFGVASLSPADVKATALLHRADLALYEAKHNGRDRVVISTPPSVIPRAILEPLAARMEV